MSLLPGRRLGPFEATAAIGAGGMGEVYRAHDTRLGRTVAIRDVISPPGSLELVVNWFDEVTRRVPAR